MKQKEVEDVLGEDQFKNADSMESKLPLVFLLLSRCFLQAWILWELALTHPWLLLAQCPSDTCNGERAYFFQLQIRSADEPMTTFLRVSPFYLPFVRADACSNDNGMGPIVHYLRRAVERLKRGAKKKKKKRQQVNAHVFRNDCLSSWMEVHLYAFSAVFLFSGR